jgi:rhamnulokinase
VEHLLALKTFVSTKAYIACDLGAESGRVVLGELSSNKVQLKELHRFFTGPTVVRGSLRWDIIKFFDEIKKGLSAAHRHHSAPAGVSVDAWGVDYAYMSRTEPLIGLPFHYRDGRTDRSYPAMLKKAGPDLIFQETGIQFMQINTLYQLYDDVVCRPNLLEIADHFLPIADYVNFLLSGQAVSELSSASTTQIFNPRKGAWSDAVMKQLGCPAKLFPPVVNSGTALGPLTNEIATETGLVGCRVFATCSHDTGAAVAAVPAEGQNWAFISSGTWSLIGVETSEPKIDAASLDANFTNELGFGGSVRFLKNIMGLWLLQETRRDLEAAGIDLDYAGLNAAAAVAPALQSVIYPNHDDFLKPGNMIEKIRSFCKATGQVPPETPGEIARCILESLALSYADMIGQLQVTFGFRVDSLHIVGGGSQSKLLNQFSADATGLPILAGPVEATALGNVLIQAVADGELSSLHEMRQIIRNSFSIERFEPANRDHWIAALERYRSITRQ